MTSSHSHWVRGVGLADIHQACKVLPLAWGWVIFFWSGVRCVQARIQCCWDMLYGSMAEWVRLGPGLVRWLTKVGRCGQVVCIDMAMMMKLMIHYAA
jgi:hypothetical protein